MLTLPASPLQWSCQSVQHGVVNNLHADTVMTEKHDNHVLASTAVDTCPRANREFTISA